MPAPRLRTPRRWGGAFPSPVVVLSILAVAMAALAFVATRDPAPTEREITPAAREQTTPSPSAKPSARPTPKKKRTPPVDRKGTYVEVYNNSGVTGLAGQVAGRATDVGWQVVGSDNWYGTIPANTVYFPPRLAREGKQLALDLGIKRTAPAVEPMRFDRLTVILTAPLG